MTEIFKDVSFSLQDGERVGLIGRNGVGKTTLVKILLGELDPDSGVVSIPRHLVLAGNHQGALCLWLIEHKLTEREFTPCSGPRSKDRDQSRHLCSSSFADILRNKQLCFHHDFGKRKYWDITETNGSPAAEHPLTAYLAEGGFVSSPMGLQVPSDRPIGPREIRPGRTATRLRSSPWSLLRPTPED